MPPLSCDACGACCMLQVEPPFPGVVVHMDRPCCWLDLTTKRCRRYDERPQACRDYVVGREDCLACRRAFGVG